MQMANNEVLAQVLLVFSGISVAMVTVSGHLAGSCTLVLVITTNLFTQNNSHFSTGSNPLKYNFLLFAVCAKDL